MSYIANVFTLRSTGWRCVAFVPYFPEERFRFRLAAAHLIASSKPKHGRHWSWSAKGTDVHSGREAAAAASPPSGAQLHEEKYCAAPHEEPADRCDHWSVCAGSLYPSDCSVCPADDVKCPSFGKMIVKKFELNNLLAITLSRMWFGIYLVTWFHYFIVC